MVNYDALSNSSFRNQSSVFDRLPFIVKIVFVLGLIGLVILMPIIFIVIASANILLASILFCILLPAIILGSVVQRRNRRKRATHLQLFAKANDWLIGTATKQSNNFILNSSEAENYGVQLLSIQGTFENTPFELYFGRKDSGSNDIQMMPLMMVLNTSKQLPKAILISREVTDNTQIFDRLLTPYENPQKVKLEGDFDAFFQLYVPRGAQINAMSLIAPDFMQTAKQFVKHFTIELSADRLTLISRSNKPSLELIKEAFEATEALMKEL